MSSAAQPGLCFLGPMLGRHHGYVTSQGLILAGRFAADRYAVVTASSRRNRYARLLDMPATLVRHSGRISVVCLEVYGGPSFAVEDLASAAARALGKPIVMVLHGGAMPDFMARYPKWTRRVLRRAAALVTPSAFLQRAVAAHGFHAQVIPNVIDLDDYSYRERARLRPRLLWMRSFHPLYNPALAIRVLARLRRHIPDATLVMAGQLKGAETDVRAAARRAGVEDAVTFAGFLDRDGKRRAGEAADIFLNTNRVDNMPVGVVEAAAMGLPVVATAVGGVPDLLGGGRYGLLVADDDEEAMTDAVLRLLNDPELAARMSRRGRELAERSAWPVVRPQWQRLFGELIKGREGLERGWPPVR